MRVLAIYLNDGGTEWCRIVDGDVAAGVRAGGDTVGELINQEIDRGGLGNSHPLSIGVGGSVAEDMRIFLFLWGFVNRSEGIKVSVYDTEDMTGVLRYASLATGPLARAMRDRGLLDAKAPSSHAAAMALYIAWQDWLNE